jgi:sugar phosphate isomerase/epimerase
LKRLISVSLAPYDGYSIARSLDSLAACGAVAVEPAFIVGYTEPFDQSAFAPAEARRWSDLLRERGLACHALSAHIDLGLDDAVDTFRPRMDFARAIGARLINTNASQRRWQVQFMRNIEILARHGDNIGLAIGLENPGNGEDNLFNRGEEATPLLQKLGLPSVGINFDSANLASHRPEANVTASTLQALPECIHYHIKDVVFGPGGWHFTPVGDGDLDQHTILSAVRALPDLPLSIELPLRLRRGPDAQPIRAAEPVPLATIEAAVKASLGYVQTILSET